MKHKKVIITEGMYRLLTEAKWNKFDWFLDIYRAFFNEPNVLLMTPDRQYYKYNYLAALSKENMVDYILTDPEFDVPSGVSKAINDIKKELEEKYDVDYLNKKDTTYKELATKKFVNENFYDLIEIQLPFIAIVSDELDMSINRAVKWTSGILRYSNLGNVGFAYGLLIKYKLFIDVQQENKFIKFVISNDYFSIKKDKKKLIEYVDIMGRKVFRLPTNVGQLISKISNNLKSQNISHHIYDSDINGILEEELNRYDEKYKLQKGTLFALSKILE